MNRREFLATAAIAGAASTQTAFGVVELRTGKWVQNRGDIETYRFHPGSSVKPFSALALLDTGPAPVMSCRGDLHIGSRQLACSHPTTAAPLDLAAAIAYSCNAYFAGAARKLPSQRLVEMYRRYALNTEVPDSPDRRALQGLGEWGVTCTLRELLHAYRQLALLRMEGNGRYIPVWEGMEAAATYGTARLACPKGMQVAGKTGTSLSRNRSGTHALFAGWAPAADPRVVVAVIVRGGTGGSDAAPVARSLFERYA